MASLRSGVAALALVALLPAARRGWTARTIAVGVAHATTMVLFVTANKLTTAAHSIFLQSTAPLYLVALAPWVLGEPIRRADLAYLAAMAAGLAACFAGTPHAFASAPDPARGNAVALLSGVSWALTVTGLRAIAAGDGAAGTTGAVVTAGNLIAFLGCLPPAWPLASGSAVDWVIVIGLGVFQIALAYTLLTAGIRRVPAFEASLLLLLEPVLNPVWAWIVQGEAPGAWTLGGGVLVLVATALRTWRTTR